MQQKQVQKQIVPIQFSVAVVEEIEDAVASGLYDSKAEFVREAVRKQIIENRINRFDEAAKRLKGEMKKKDVKLESPFVPREVREQIWKEYEERIARKKKSSKHVRA